MKKIININFHGRVVPIEETAYDILKQYVDSLRKYFANEEGRDEIINDIENRFAELFTDRLQKGSTCIADEDVNAIILSMGRPEDFEKDDMSQQEQPSGGTGQQKNYQQSQQQAYQGSEPRQLFRSENDKILGGVCAGLASYLKVDPAIVRIVFALITFGGFGLGILLYIILWAVLPTRALAANARRRLYRNPDSRVIGGVASGLAAYFHIEVWIPRLIFSLPLIAGVFTSIFHRAFHDFYDGPMFLTGGFGGTLFLTYIILWIVLPEANTASEKLEMRGEKIDLESIKNTIKNDLGGVKGRATAMGNEMKERATQFGQEFKQAAQHFSAEAGPIVRKTGTGFGHAIGVLFKAFFLFIGGVIVFALTTALIGLMFTGAGVLPFSKFLLSGFWQHFFGWGTLILFLVVPIIGLLTWLIRRIIGVRSQRHYLGYVFGTLWTLGWVCLIFFVSMAVNNFRIRSSIEDDLPITQPRAGKMLVNVSEGKVDYYGSDWFGMNWDNHDAPFYDLTEDSVMMNTVRINLTKSPDSSYHVQRVRFSHGSDPAQAKMLASEIKFDLQQTDSLLLLPQGFAITPTQKFRNQQVLIVIAIPVGGKIQLGRAVQDYHWFNIRINRRRGYMSIGSDDDWNDYNPVESDVEFTMTEHGLEKTHKVQEDSIDGSEEAKPPKPRDGYRYKGKGDSSKTGNSKNARPASFDEDQAEPAEDQPAAAAPAIKQVALAKTAMEQDLENDDEKHSFAPILSLITQ